MDRRYEAYKSLIAKFGAKGVLGDVPGDNEFAAIHAFLDDGKQGEFWQYISTKINEQIRAAESRFLDVLAKDYDTYVAWWSRRQALIAVLAIPETPMEKG